MKVIKLRGLQASQMDLNTPVSDFHFWVHELLMSLTWASGECPGQAKFECFLSQGEAGIQFVFFLWAQTVELDNMELLATCI